MYKVLLVDDEPAALEYIGRIIEKKCNRFEIAGRAGSSEEALLMLKEIPADMIITDIKMAELDGLALIEKVKEERPETEFVIISGYSDFEYAKQAILNQVHDYILKPVDPMEFAEIMDKAAKKLDERAFLNRTALLRSLCHGVYVSEEELKEGFEDKDYYAFLIRRNNLPHRFETSGAADVYSAWHESIIMYGRDENEALFLIPAQCVDGWREFQALVKKAREKYRIDGGFVTVAVKDCCFPVEEMAETVRGLYVTLLQSLVYGHDQVLYPGKTENSSVIAGEQRSELWAVWHHVNNREYEKASLELKKLCDDFEKRRIPEIQVQNMIRQVCNFVWMSENYQEYSGNTEYLLEDILYNALNMDMLYQSVNELLFPGKEGIEKIDTPEFFEQIRRYVNIHLHETMTLNHIGRVFGISQSSISCLFRKYAGKSFNAYLTAIRMERARELLETQPELLIRDVAEMVGYADQLYFSRVFKSVTGRTPSEYAKTKES
ncbi:MAG: response regulator [Eubacteriales bacterium]|nr:response regulator [Eubacteriales bacterium]